MKYFFACNFSSLNISYFYLSLTGIIKHIYPTFTHCVLPAVGGNYSTNLPCCATPGEICPLHNDSRHIQVSLNPHIHIFYFFVLSLYLNTCWIFHIFPVGIFIINHENSLYFTSSFLSSAISSVLSSFLNKVYNVNSNIIFYREVAYVKPHIDNSYNFA